MSNSTLAFLILGALAGLSAVIQKWLRERRSRVDVQQHAKIYGPANPVPPATYVEPATPKGTYWRWLGALLLIVILAAIWFPLGLIGVLAAGAQWSRIRHWRHMKRGRRMDWQRRRREYQAQANSVIAEAEGATGSLGRSKSKSGWHEIDYSDPFR
jgi:hypothetical protein